MYKWMYDRMIVEYSKETKEELIQRIIALEEIECNDRCFANQCEAGTAIYNIDKLFHVLETFLRSDFSPEKILKIHELTVQAKSEWNYIKHGLNKLNNSCRCEKTLEDFKQRVDRATENNDTI